MRKRDDAADLEVILDFIMGGRKAPWFQPRSFTGSGLCCETGGLTRREPPSAYRVSLYPSWGGGKMKFKVGRFTCEVSLDDDRKLLVKWLPEPPKYLNKTERDQYQAGVAEFLEGLDVKDPTNFRRLNGGG
jgi:hypothetical protein